LIIQLGDFNAKIERKNNFKPRVGNLSLHQDNNNNNNNNDGVRIEKFVTSKIWL